jgi:NADH:ubiquinone reductase (H+-translocating)
MKPTVLASNKKRVVIVGGGFGGLKLAKELANSNFQVVLLDRNNYHQFQPLFYQVATAGLEPSSIIFPFRKIFQNRKMFHFRLGELIAVHPEGNLITTTIGEIHFDVLVLATGVMTNFFGNKNIEKYALPMKSVYEALYLRNRIFTNLEESLTVQSEDEMKKALNMVIVGGGPTGVELAGTLAEMKRFILPKDYPELDFSNMKIYLIEGGGCLLNGMSEVSSQKAFDYLEKMGVDVVLNDVVEEYDGHRVQLKKGEALLSKNLIWAAGVVGDRIAGIPETANAPGGRIFVNQYSQVKSFENIYALGDIACMSSDENPRGHTQMAQPAIQQGKNLARNLMRLENQKEMVPFVYKNLGSMSTVGRNKAVVELPNYKFHGFFAWVVWMVVHLRSILGIKNKLIVFLNWVWNYLTYNLSLRLIIQPPNRKDKRA